MAARVPLRALALARASARPALAIPAASARRWASSQPGPSEPSTSSTSEPKPAPASPAAAAEDKPGDKPDPYAIPPLSRPLGTPRAPTSAPMSKQQKIDRLLDRDRRKAERKVLFKEASQGYFHDYNRARKANGGKLWMAPPVLIREDRALYFPDVEGKALSGQQVHTTDLFKGKANLVTILNTRISEEHVQSFVEPVLEDWEGNPLFNYIQINHQANPLKSMLLSFFISGLKRSVPETRWGTYFISSGEWSELDITGPLGIENKLLGYVFLVDENAKVRWAGCGAAKEDEVEALRRATAVLIRRMGESGEPKPLA